MFRTSSKKIKCAWSMEIPYQKQCSKYVEIDQKKLEKEKKVSKTEEKNNNKIQIWSCSIKFYTQLKCILFGVLYYYHGINGLFFLLLVQHTRNHMMNRWFLVLLLNAASKTDRHKNVKKKRQNIFSSGHWSDFKKTIHCVDQRELCNQNDDHVSTKTKCICFL